MIEFLLFVVMWLMLGFAFMRYVAIPWDGNDASTWTVTVLFFFTISFPLVFATMLCLMLMDWFAKRDRNGNSPSDTIKKWYGLE